MKKKVVINNEHIFYGVICNNFHVYRHVSNVRVICRNLHAVSLISILLSDVSSSSVP